MIKLYNKDCFEVFKEMDDESIDVVITSPPYNIGKDYSGYQDNKAEKEYVYAMSEVASYIKDLLRDDGSLFFNFGTKPSNQQLLFKVIEAMCHELTLQNTFHWIKSIAIEDGDSYYTRGHYKPINSKRYVNDCHEYIFHFTKNGDVELDRKAIGVPHKDQSNVKRWGSSSRCRGNTWFIPYETRNKQHEHPAAFPKKLVENCLKLQGLDKISTVLDPFAGSGTTLEVAEEFGKDSIGIEISEEYYKLMLDKFELNG